ncbi:hypothetical protein FA15DRAFT_666828 [Coprinopsis marcescibilis]|uniref:Uncharacterized protein n=1 Tax=Coprinopsis marcescibilis TaxID=230819 RepID=A0A5C3L3B4_COPMA|nr:hypothetical protein FA15DRAFT_666828 [Coprinopsis marcescibilis]
MPGFFPNNNHRLPVFKSMLVIGPHHASAPIHLALSYAAEHPNSSPLILSSSRTSFKEDLVALNDGWISSTSRQGNMMEALSRVNLLYPPTPLHLSMLLSTVRCLGPKDVEASPSVLNPKTMLASSPGLIILHEPSLYFADHDEFSSHTLSTYMSLVTRTFAALDSLAEKRSPFQPSFALFDSGLPDLKLPLVGIKVLPSERYIPRPPNARKLEPVLPYIEKYFEWVCCFESPSEEEETVPSSQGEEEVGEDQPRSVRQFKLYRVSEELDEPHHITWEQATRPSLDQNRPTTHFRVYR